MRRIVFIWFALFGFLFGEVIRILPDVRGPKPTAVASPTQTPTTVPMLIAELTGRERAIRHIIEVMAPIRIEVIPIRGAHIMEGVDARWFGEGMSLDEMHAKIQAQILDLMAPCPALRRLSPYYPI